MLATAQHNVIDMDHHKKGMSRLVSTFVSHKINILKIITEVNPFYIVGKY